MSGVIPIYEFLPQMNAVIKVLSMSTPSFYLHMLPGTTLTREELQICIAGYLRSLPSAKRPADLTMDRVSILFVHPHKVTTNQEYIFNSGITEVYVNLFSKQYQLKKEASDRIQSEINSLRLEMDRLKKKFPPIDMSVKAREMAPELGSREPTFDELDSQLITVKKQIEELKALTRMDVVVQKRV